MPVVVKSLLHLIISKDLIIYTTQSKIAYRFFRMNRMIVDGVKNFIHIIFTDLALICVFRVSQTSPHRLASPTRNGEMDFTGLHHLISQIE